MTGTCSAGLAQPPESSSDLTYDRCQLSVRGCSQLDFARLRHGCGRESRIRPRDEPVCGLAHALSHVLGVRCQPDSGLTVYRRPQMEPPRTESKPLCEVMWEGGLRAPGLHDAPLALMEVVGQ